MNADAIQITRTARDTGDWLTDRPEIFFREPVESGIPAVLVDPHLRYQEIIGFGGAFTEAAAVTFFRMNAEAQAAILKAYFDPSEGIGYTLCRTHINSCDFSLGNYAYDEIDGDITLEHFSIERDRQDLIPLIRAACDTAGRELKLFASPWSPPWWMKTNGEMNHGGKLRLEYRAAWARYFVRYLQAYAAEGLPIWGLTVQNEPEATQTWDSCRYSAEEERDFVRDFLGPELAASGFGGVRLMVHDHNRDHLYQRAKVIYDDPQAASYVWGAGFHWYVGDNFDNVERLHDAYPDKHLLFTEGCVEGGPHSGDWAVGERYGRSILNDLNRWTEGWVDWNLLLDEGGGPNHVGNFCSAPVLADTRRADRGGVHFHHSFAYIGQFSRFITPGARRVGCAPTHDDLEATAFNNPDGKIALVVMNRSERDLPFSLDYAGRSALSDAPRHSISTFRFSE